MSEVQQQVIPGTLPAPPATATEASARLTALGADKAWAQRFYSGDIAAQKEFEDLNIMIAEGGDKIDRAMSGVLPDLPDGDLKQMAGLAEMLRDIGIRDDLVRQTLSGQEVTQAEYDATKRWHDQHMRDQEFTKKWLAGDPEVAKQMTLAHIILSSEIKQVAA
jgi:hypothetical protein